jgi:FtsZ-binding cell division protein ZapB
MPNWRDNIKVKKQMAKQLVFSDESINSYGFYLKNDGADLSLYKKNPILLWMHSRAWRGTKDEVLPIGTVKDIRFNQKSQQWEAEPVFDLDDKFAAEIARKWENGILRMASAGIRPIEFSEDKKLLKKGQTRATVTKWLLKEISIADIGSNYNAVALYNEDDEMIRLAETGENIPVPELKFNQNNSDMETIKLADGKEMTVDQVEKLVEKVTSQEQTITTLTQERDGLKAKAENLENTQKAARNAEAVTLVDAAIKDGRIDNDGKSAKDNWLKFFETDHEGAKNALASIPKRKSVVEQIKSSNNDVAIELASFEKKSWDELDKSGKLVTLRDKYPDLYEQKFEEKFGRKPKK